MTAIVVVFPHPTHAYCRDTLYPTPTPLSVSGALNLTLAIYSPSMTIDDKWFLADRTIGRAYGTVCRL